MGSSGTIGRYQVLGEAGRGGMGVVYRAYDPAIRRYVAIKTIGLSQVTDPQERRALWERLVRESQISGALMHPNIVAVHDLFEQGEMAYVVMEYVDGPSLERLLSGGARPGPALLLRTLYHVAGALDFAHSKGVVHRDVKPANILIQSDGAPKVTDFGIARAAFSPALTGTGFSVGSPSYMAPEQIEGRATDGRTDQFSLAVTAFQGLTGRRPFEADSPSAVFYRVLSEEPARAAAANPELGNEVDAVFAKALSKTPEARYPTCVKFIEELWGAVDRRGGVRLGPLPSLAMTPAGAVMGTAAGSALRRVAVVAPAAVVAVVTAWYAYTRVERPAPPAPETLTIPGEVRPASAPVEAAAPPPEPAAEPAPDRPPKSLRETVPVYPELARSARVEGVVRLAVVVGPDGAVRRVRVLSGHPLLIPAAMDAVRQWKYRPARKKGLPVEAQTVVDVRFTLKR